MQMDAKVKTVSYSIKKLIDFGCYKNVLYISCFSYMFDEKRDRVRSNKTILFSRHV